MTSMRTPVVMLSAERFLVERKEAQAPVASFKKGEYINLLRWSEMGQMRQQPNTSLKMILV